MGGSSTSHVVLTDVLLGISKDLSKCSVDAKFGPKLINVISTKRPNHASFDARYILRRVTLALKGLPLSSILKLVFFFSLTDLRLSSLYSSPGVKQAIRNIGIKAGPSSNLLKNIVKSRVVVTPPFSTLIPQPPKWRTKWRRSSWLVIFSIPIGTF